MTVEQPSMCTTGCVHEAVRLYGHVDAAGCTFAALRCVDCGELLHEEET